ncbi:hypothetical protein CONCODRAFT_14380 [Conidiobolus coronatus NRRL 28638]|uniref:Uncharacterized protein n=1 Tax=Conidiobolus coronatus (strain ATCC 28846 / CBS 209.66 / NRRL 28638) TaxID=796925 RepID=A0A137PJ66_CONC2|nr:hypothetical protein CONCODRAFT_14380 [Conidiobolus coronatus NRRL 28638]|eukprot:KXN75044.1 hypothetical protein CONCODRAFT_14380 [Conidiobolus coronatus NRRL 28638]
MSNSKLTDTFTNEITDKNGYPQFIASLKDYFRQSVDGGKQLFNTEVDNLYDLYLSNLPKEDQQRYTCNACKLFIDRFGGLVTIDENIAMKSVMWSVEHAPAFFIPAVAAMRSAVLRARVKGVFIPDSRVLGKPVTGKWTHLSIPLPHTSVDRSIIRTASQQMAEKHEDFKILSRVSSIHSKKTIDRAIALLKSETVYRGDRYVSAAEWFKQKIIYG